ncbi:50S ribosomal protein L29 [Blattabacterium cuenoti]|uniref:50S ribosomal protein L29 n=1 Tax=Blattabacterium cuenoti TaxID=1653831 RepID=UPI00163B6787|nr:50S ribosomal protein L29 [Blattabacterium cuenoti]
MKKIDIKILSIEDLIEKIKISKKDYQNMKLNHSMKLEKNPINFKYLRKNIAKLKTELNKKLNAKK